jgi:uncharacterized membrane protein
MVFGGLHGIQIVIAATCGLGWGFGSVGTTLHLGAGLMLLDTLNFLSLVLLIVRIVKASKGVRFKVLVAGKIAEKTGDWNALNCWRTLALPCHEQTGDGRATNYEKVKVGSGVSQAPH